MRLFKLLKSEGQLLKFGNRNRLNVTKSHMRIEAMKIQALKFH